MFPIFSNSFAQVLDSPIRAHFVARCAHPRESSVQIRSKSTRRRSSVTEYLIAISAMSNDDK